MHQGQTQGQEREQEQEANERETEASTSTSNERMRMTAGQMALTGLGLLVFGIGIVGIFVPLLPTTPLVMLAAFLLARSSPRLHARILRTKTYRTYVLPFKEKGGMARTAKIRALAISLGVLAVSAAIVRIWYAWVILGIVAAAISYTLIVRVPTQKSERTEHTTEREPEPTQYNSKNLRHRKRKPSCPFTALNATRVSKIRSRIDLRLGQAPKQAPPIQPSHTATQTINPHTNAGETPIRPFSGQNRILCQPTDVKKVRQFER